VLSPFYMKLFLLMVHPTEARFRARQVWRDALAAMPAAGVAEGPIATPATTASAGSEGALGGVDRARALLASAMLQALSTVSR